MKLLKITLLFTFLIGISTTTIAQTNVNEVPEGQIFTPKDKDFLQLWYYDQVLKMDLDEDGRYDYLALLTYYTYKMTRLALPKYKLNDAQQKEQFDILTQKLDAEMQDFLSPENYAIHKESFTIIVEKVYTQKNWE